MCTAAHAPQWEKPAPWEAREPQLESSPRSPQLEKVRGHQWRSSAGKNKHLKIKQPLKLLSFSSFYRWDIWLLSESYLPPSIVLGGLQAQVCLWSNLTSFPKFCSSEDWNMLITMSNIWLVFMLLFYKHLLRMYTEFTSCPKTCHSKGSPGEEERRQK